MTFTGPVALIPNGFQPHYVTNLANGLARNNVQVQLLGSDIHLSDRLDPRVEFTNLRGSHERAVPVLEKIRRVVKYYFRLAAFTQRSNCPLFHVLWLRFGFFDGVAMNRFFRLYGKQVVYTVHTVIPHDRDTYFNRFVYNAVYRSCDALVTHTGFLRDRLVREFGVPPGRIHIMKHGVYEPPDHPEITAESARRKLGFAPEEKILLSFGKIAPYKGLDLLLPVYLKCRRVYPNLRLVIAGHLDPQYTGKFNALLPSEYSSQGITVRRGYVPDEEAELFFKAADLVVLPYRESSQSGVLFLAYAYGRPVVISHLGSFPEDVVPGVTGFTFRVGDPEDLKGVLLRALEHFGTQPEKVVQTIRFHAAHRYSWEASGRTLVNLYAMLLRRSSAARATAASRNR